MKHLRHLSLGLLLVLALSIPAFAGETPCGLTDGPQESPGLTGEIPFPGITGPQESPGIVGDIQTPGLSFLFSFFG